MPLTDTVLGEFVNEISSAAPANLRKLGGLNSDPILNNLLFELRGFAALLKEYDLEVAIDSPASHAAWAGLDTSKQQGIFKNFSTYYRNCLEMHAAGISLRDNRAFVFHSLKRANLFAVDDTTNLFTNDHMVEVYNLGNIQIFRSINFFDYCNYSLLDLLAREWMDLYERLPSITNSLFKELSSAIEAKELRPILTPAHVMRERDANPCGVFKTDVLSCCPLYSAPGVLAGYLLVWDVTEIDLESPDNQRVTFLRN
jgi:hypothetical protein